MLSLRESRLAFIGGGNMASSIIKGLVNEGMNKQNIIVSGPWYVNREKIAAVGVQTTTSNAVAGKEADLVIIAVKPQVTKNVCKELGVVWLQRASLPIAFQDTLTMVRLGMAWEIPVLFHPNPAVLWPLSYSFQLAVTVRNTTL